MTNWLLSISLWATTSCYGQNTRTVVFSAGIDGCETVRNGIGDDEIYRESRNKKIVDQTKVGY